MFIYLFASIILSVNWISKLELLKDVLEVFRTAEQVKFFPFSPHCTSTSIHIKNADGMVFRWQKERTYSASYIKCFTVIFTTHSITIEGLGSSTLDNATKALNHNSKIEITD